MTNICIKLLYEKGIKEGSMNRFFTLKLWLVLLLVLSMLLLVGCKQDVSKQETDSYTQQDFAMGTVITQKIYGEKAKVAAEEVITKIRDIENRMTINTPGGEINKLNDLAGIRGVKLSKDSIYVLEKAKHYSRISVGAFDVTLGPLIKAWGVFTDSPRVPSDEEIKELLKLVDYNSINIDRDNLSAKLEKRGQIVDLGGIAKGFAGDEAIKIYKNYGIKSAFVNLGGNVVVLGSKPDGSPWKIGIQNPRAENGKYIAILEVEDKAVVTSGDYERYFESNGKRYHHILDPKTGYPSNSGIISATVVSDTSIDADALSTALFVMGLDEGFKLVEKLNGVDAIFITEDKKVFISDGLKDSFLFSDESKEYEYVEKR